MSLRAGLLGLVALSTALLFACNSSTSSSDSTPPPAVSTIVYNDTTHTTTSSWACDSDPTYYEAGWIINSSTATDRRLYVRVGNNGIASATYDVIGHTATTTEVAGKASIRVMTGSGVLLAGSPTTSTASVQVTVFANGDSARFVGDSIALEGGKTVSFNLAAWKTCD